MVSTASYHSFSTMFRRVLKYTSAASIAVGAASGVYIYNYDKGLSRLIYFNAKCMSMFCRYHIDVKLVNYWYPPDPVPQGTRTMTTTTDDGALVSSDTPTVQQQSTEALEPQLHEKHLSLVRQKYAKEAFDLVLALGGYYVKIAQTTVGAQLLPSEEFEDVFERFLDNLEPKSFNDVIKPIVVHELRQNEARHQTSTAVIEPSETADADTADDESLFRKYFASFEQAPIGAASVGQVHRAVLNDEKKTPVVVKIQYPDVAEFFPRDVLSMRIFFYMGGISSENTDKMLQSLVDAMQSEFDYETEASLMMRVRANILPKYKDRVYIPYAIPSMCTRRMLTMEYIEGEPLKKKLDKLYDYIALSAGFRSGRELVKHKIKEFKEMSKKKGTRHERDHQPQHSQSAAPAASSLNNVLRQILTPDVYHALRFNFLRFICLPLWSLWMKVRFIMSRRMLRRGCNNDDIDDTNVTPSHGGLHQAASAPPELVDGYRIFKLLADVHAHQLFRDGLYNSDPHAGNIIMMPDGRLGLIDFGATVDISHEKRNALARIILAVAERTSSISTPTAATSDDVGNDSHTHKPYQNLDTRIITAMKDFGYYSQHLHPTVMLAYAYVFFHRGYTVEGMEDLYRDVGVPRFVGAWELDEYLCRLDPIEEVSRDVWLAQRCLMLLLGDAEMAGISGVSMSHTWRHHAETYLKEVPGFRSATSEMKNEEIHADNQID